MAPAVERRDRIRRSDSPVGDRRSPRRRSSPRRERSPAHHRSSPRMRSPHKSSSSYRARSPVKERLPDRTGSPKQAPHRLSSRASPSRSPSPRTKRLRHAQLDRGADKLAEKEHVNSANREDKGRHREHEEGRDAQNDKRPPRDRNDGGSSRSSRRERSMSPEEHGHRSRYSSRSRSRSPPRPSKAGGRDAVTKSSATAEHMNGDNDSVAKMKAAEEALEGKEKQKPSFELSGKLADETNRVRGITLLFTEPADARKPDVRWRLYVFKAGEVLNEPLYVHRQTCYLFGRERRIADIPTDHPSCSKQHAVLQYRLVEKERPDGLMSKQPRICVITRELQRVNGLELLCEFLKQPCFDSLPIPYLRVPEAPLVVLLPTILLYPLFNSRDYWSILVCISYFLNSTRLFCWMTIKKLVFFLCKWSQLLYVATVWLSELITWKLLKILFLSAVV